MPATFLYFAYGSNLKLSEIRRTCSTAERKCRAKLLDHRLVFPRKSVARNCGVASVDPSAGDCVWGGAYCIPETERSKLEEREGYKRNRGRDKNSYVPQDVTVLNDGDLAKPLGVLTFIANAQPNPPLPSAEYKGLIIDGAKEWALDADYVARLKKIATL